MWDISSIKDRDNKDQTTALGEQVASVSLYAWLLLLGEPFASTHFLVN